jgi:hypothetical protein
MMGLILLFLKTRMFIALAKRDARKPSRRREDRSHRGPAILMESTGQEAARVGGGPDAEAEQDGDDVDERAAGGLGEALGHAAFLQQVAEEQEAQEGDRAGRDARAEHEGDDGKEDPHALAHGAGGLHTDQAFLACVVSSLMMGGWITGTSAM